MARGREYDLLDPVRDPGDLEIAHDAGYLDDDDFETLTELLTAGLSLELASREELYLLPGVSWEDAGRIVAFRDREGHIERWGELVSARILSRQQLRTIRPFLLPDPVVAGRRSLWGRLRLRVAWSPVDHLAPTGALQSSWHRGDMQAGMAAVTTRQRLGSVTWNSSPWFVVDEHGREGVLVTTSPRPRLHLPKLFASVDRPRWGLLLGTFSAGFGQGATFSASSRRSLQGFYGDDSLVGVGRWVGECRESGGDLSSGLRAAPCTGVRRQARVLADFGWQDRQRGFAVRLGPTAAESRYRGTRLFLWASTQSRSVYQYDIYHTQLCTDPRRDDTEWCQPPFVYRGPIQVGRTTTRYRQYQLPALFTERLVGGHVSYQFTSRGRTGMTAYAADWLPRPAGAQFDLRPTARFPAGGVFGAVGVDAEWGAKWLDLALEATQVVTDTNRNPGLGAVTRATAAWSGGQVEWSQRYYATNFENPYAGSPAAADEYEGLRARDELGTRLEYTGATAGRRLTTQALVDLWLRPSTGRLQLLASWRGDLQLTRALRSGVRLQLRNRGLAGRGRTACAEPNAESSPTCEGEAVSVGIRARLEPQWWCTLTAEHRYSWYELTGSQSRWAADQSARLLVALTPHPALEMRVRARWSDEDTTRPDRGATAVGVAGELVARLPTETRVALRYDLVRYVDARPSTRLRSPNPEHWGRLDLVQRF